jgi:hypothetical protein
LPEGVENWRDAAPASLLPLTGFEALLAALRHPLGASLDSEISRIWDAESGCWRITGRHALAPFSAPWRTRAVVSPFKGLTGFELLRGDRLLLTAELSGTGLKADAGVPGWTRKEAEVA